MVDISDYAKQILAFKEQQGDEAKLDYDNVVELIIMAIRDAQFDSDEIFQFNHITEFTHGRMTEEAKKLFTDFYEGFTGQREIEIREVDLYEMAKQRFDRLGGKSAKLDVKDISDMIINVIRDGKITSNEYEKFKKAEFFKIYNMSDAATSLYDEFLGGLARIFEDTMGSGQSTESTVIYDKDDTSIGSDQFKVICDSCNGLGKSRCRSCKGKGGRSSSTIDTDEYGNVIYKDKWLNCPDCSTGYIACAECKGSGSL